MKRRALHERISIFPAYRDDNLFSGWTLCHHLDARFWFGLTIDDVVYLINLLSIEEREYFFDFQNLQCVVERFGCLSIRLAKIV